MQLNKSHECNVDGECRPIMYVLLNVHFQREVMQLINI